MRKIWSHYISVFGQCGIWREMLKQTWESREREKESIEKHNVRIFPPELLLESSLKLGFQ